MGYIRRKMYWGRNLWCLRLCIRIPEQAGLTDELTASIHYGEVSAFIDRYLKEHTFQLLEKVAESLAEELLLQTKGLQKIRLEIKNRGHRSDCRLRRSV